MSKKDQIRIGQLSGVEKGINWQFSTETAPDETPYSPDLYGVECVKIMGEIMTDKRPSIEELKQRFLDALEAGDHDEATKAMAELQARGRELRKAFIMTASQQPRLLPPREKITENLLFDMPNWDNFTPKDIK